MKLKKQKKITEEVDVEVEEEEDVESDIELESEDDDDDDHETFKSMMKRNLEEAGDEKPAKKMKKDNDLYKPPTVEELNQLRETETLFHSNLFRLQIEEVLTEVKPKDKYKKQFDTWFKKFKDAVMAIKETEDKELSNLKSLKKLKVKVADVEVPVNEKGTYRFLKPSNISVIGSYSLGTTVGPNIVIDVMIEMPSALFQKHDYQNYRYLRKRAIYLAYVAANLNSEVAEKKSYYGESWMPKLKIVPAGSLSKRVTVNLHLAAESTSFKLSRFLPEKNSVRPQWYFKDDSKSDDLVPTPYYNSNILRDLTMAETNSQNSKMISEYPNLRDGIILLKIWLHQRQPEQAYDGFNGHILTMYVLYLLYEKKLSTYMSSYQIIRNVWNNLAQSNWTEQGISMCQEPDGKSRVSQYHKYYDCVFIDTTGYHNLVANVSACNYLWVRSEASQAIKFLDSSKVDSFYNLFMKRLNFYSTFDHFVCLHDTQALEQLADKVPDDCKLDLGLNKRAQVIRQLMDVLKKGLGKRVSEIYIQPEQFKDWEVTDDCSAGIGKILIGLQLNPDYCFNIIDKGPGANLPEAEEFRKFWGTKSELRRFQDGSVCEAAVWVKKNPVPKENLSNKNKISNKKKIADEKKNLPAEKAATLSEKRIICKHIVMYLFKVKFNLTKDQYLYVANQVEDVLHFKNTIITKFRYGTGEEATLQVLKVFGEFEKELTSLADLPLAITGVQGGSPVFRYTDVFPPLATVYKADDKNTKAGDHCLLLNEGDLEEVPKYAPAIEASVQLSGSGKWPDELEAVRKTKAAFHIQIAQCLRNQLKLKAKANVSHVDIFREGFVFRLRVAHQKEIAFMKRIVDENGVIKYRDNEESLELENKLFHLPKLTGALYGLHSQQPSFGPTCCLAKRWLSAQLIDYSHMPEVVVELIVAFIYLSPDPYKPTQMPQVGFIRFLEFFASKIWNTEAIIVNFNDEMTREEVLAVENIYGTTRETLPALFISTPYDHKSSTWTKKSPSRLILSRISSLAKETLRLLETELLKSSTLIWSPMFKPPLSAYDCLIHLKDQFNPRRYQYLDIDGSLTKTTWHPYKHHPHQKLPVVEFNPVEKYLEELRAGYGEFALFFHDTYGGSVIGVLLNPRALDIKDFKVGNINCRRLDTNGKLVLNIAAMIEDFSIIGQGLVDKIDLQSDKLL
ncbi:nucleolar protein 6 [Microplitis mediator]|uniref:nucleolar protein 6 n=1 Tax=Microplitis mediator TaxID=375433 RepID=UPI002552AE0D|nr:nucleolar protein 6 [Microplitis mediator]